MAIFSTNQVNQFYVVKYVVTTGTHLAKNAAVGSILPIARPDGTIQFEYMSPGGVITSDRINPKNVKYKSYAKGANHPGHIIKSVKLTLNAIKGSVKVLAEQSYVLRITFESFIGNTMRDNHWLHGEVRGGFEMTASEFYKRMACSLARNMAREASTLVDVYLSANGTALSKQITPADATTTKEAALVADSTEYVAIIIKEHAQDPKLLGCGEEDPVVFDVEPLAINVDGVDISWGTAETIVPIAPYTYFDGTNHAAATAMPNGIMIAEMEYFFMGERGDQERMQGYPNIVPTKYLIENRYGTYSVLNIHFYFEDEGTSVQHSDKDVTLVGDETTLIKLVTGNGPIKTLTWTQIGTTGDFK